MEHLLELCVFVGVGGGLFILALYTGLKKDK